MPRYQITAHVYEDDQRAEMAGIDLLKAVRFEIDAESLFLAHDDALCRLRILYPAKRIEVTAEEVDAERI